MKNHAVPLNTKPGTCPEYDPFAEEEEEVQCRTTTGGKCKCHGPTLAYGMVGWSGGTNGGPDFFINLWKDPLTYLGTQYTVFGVVEGSSSFDLLEEFLDVDTSLGKSNVFVDVIHFHIGLE